jgi:hypothetical protein
MTASVTSAAGILLVLLYCEQNDKLVPLSSPPCRSPPKVNAHHDVMASESCTPVNGSLNGDARGVVYVPRISADPEKCHAVAGTRI